MIRSCSTVTRTRAGAIWLLLTLTVAATGCATGKHHSSAATKPAAPSARDVVHAQPGSSLQKTIDAAPRSATIVLAAGVYTGNITISKPLTLEAAHGVVLTPGPSVEPNGCTRDAKAHGSNAVTGICIESPAAEQATSPPTQLSDVSITGLTIDGFSDAGIFAAYTSKLRLADLSVRANGQYGVIVDNSRDADLTHSTITSNHGGGIHLVQDDDVTLTHNTSTGNVGEGAILADSSQITIDGNQLSDNCAGLVFVNTGAPGLAGPARITDNTIRHNNRSCPSTPPSGDEAGRPISEHGIGIALGGTTGVTATLNTVTDNDGPAAGPAGRPALAGGLILISSAGFGGSTPTHNVLRDNKLSGNAPVDILTDHSGSANQISSNTCQRTNTSGSC